MAKHRSDYPYSGAVAVTKSDSTVIPVTRGLYIGGTGAITVRMADGMDATFTAVPVGVLPIQVDMIKNATVATNIVALY